MKLFFQTISLSFLIAISFSALANTTSTLEDIQETPIETESDSSNRLNDDDKVVISIYPIPADKEFNINIESKSSDKVKVKLINMESGMTTILENINVIGHNFSTYDVSLYPTGNYMLIVLEDDVKIFSKKILINHVGI